jgi:hypothetical protein
MLQHCGNKMLQHCEWVGSSPSRTNRASFRCDRHFAKLRCHDSCAEMGSALLFCVRNAEALRCAKGLVSLSDRNPRSRLAGGSLIRAQHRTNRWPDMFRGQGPGLRYKERRGARSRRRARAQNCRTAGDCEPTVKSSPTRSQTALLPPHSPFTLAAIPARLSRATRTDQTLWALRVTRVAEGACRVRERRQAASGNRKEGLRLASRVRGFQ